MKLLFALVILSLLSGRSWAVELTPDASQAFTRYIADFEARRAKSDRFIEEDTPQHHQDLLNGKILISPAGSTGETQVRGGLIHDFVGTMFIPSTTMAKVLSLVRDYDRQKVIYAPDVADSRIRSHKGQDEYNVYMRVVKSKMMISDVLNTEHEIHFSYPAPNRVYCRSYSTRVAEVADPGKPDEHELPVGNDRGMLWRMDGFWFFEQRDGGVYVEFETISLSRDIPFIMGKVLGPILHGLPAESLRISLDKTRKAVLAEGSKPSD